MASATSVRLSIPKMTGALPSGFKVEIFTFVRTTDRDRSLSSLASYQLVFNYKYHKEIFRFSKELKGERF